MKKTIILIASSVVVASPNLNLFNINQKSIIKKDQNKNINQNYQVFLNKLETKENTQYKNFELTNIAQQLENRKKFLFNDKISISFVKQSYQKDFNEINIFQNNFIDFEILMKKKMKVLSKRIT